VDLYYHHLASPPVRKVRAVAFELGLAPHEIAVDWDGGAHRRPPFVALNANAKFPVLVDGDFVLWESNAICQYLATLVPAAAMLPFGDERARADVTRWQCWELAHFSPAVQRLIGLRGGKRPAEPDALATAEADFARWAAVLEAHLADRRFLVGERRTVADFSVAAMLMYADLAQLSLADSPAVARWFALVQALPGWQRSRPT
jgi:glutathione S-transferase